MGVRQRTATSRLAHLSCAPVFFFFFFSLSLSLYIRLALSLAVFFFFLSLSLSLSLPSPCESAGPAHGFSSLLVRNTHSIPWNKRRWQERWR